MYKVLLVDDEKSLNAVLSKGMDHEGFDVVSAFSGNEAIELFEDPSFSVDIVISDLYMNGGGGQQLIAWVRENRPNLKILAISGEDTESFMSALDIIEGEGVPTMEKPFQVAQLAEVVRGMLKSNLF